MHIRVDFCECDPANFVSSASKSANLNWFKLLDDLLHLGIEVRQRASSSDLVVVSVDALNIEVWDVFWYSFLKFLLAHL